MRDEGGPSGAGRENRHAGGARLFGLYMVDRQGRILIPAAARAWCGIEPGDTLLVFMDGDEDTLLLRKGETPPAPDAPEENRQTVAEEVDTGQAPTQSGPWIYFF